MNKSVISTWFFWESSVAKINKFTIANWPHKNELICYCLMSFSIFMWKKSHNHAVIKFLFIFISPATHENINSDRHISLMTIFQLIDSEKFEELVKPHSMNFNFFCLSRRTNCTWELMWNFMHAIYSIAIRRIVADRQSSLKMMWELIAILSIKKCFTFPIARIPCIHSDII